MADNEIKVLVITATLIFLIAPAFVLLYIIVYNRRKKALAEEKEELRLAFEAELINSQMAIREQTLQTIGADLHDNIGQILSLTALTLGAVELDDHEKANERIDTARELTSRSINELRLLGKLIQGEQLISMGLKEALQHEIGWIEKTGRYRIDYVCDPHPQEVVNVDKDLIVFRIIQELLQNIIKHAGASSIDLYVKYSDEKMKVSLTDNGRGFKAEVPGEQSKGMGMFNIRKRVGLLGGELQISSVPDQGSSIKINLPYP